MLIESDQDLVDMLQCVSDTLKATGQDINVFLTEAIADKLQQDSGFGE